MYRKQSSIKEAQDTGKVFLSFVNPHKPISKDTTSRWTREMLKMSGIDTEKFKAHSKRAASTSEALRKGVSIDDILKMGNWSNKSVWQKYYKKDLSAAERYQEKLLG